MARIVSRDRKELAKHKSRDSADSGEPEKDEGYVSGYSYSDMDGDDDE
jgi:hypothetical protein